MPIFQKHQQARVLVVDDNAMGRQMLRAMLENIGIQVSEAKNGLEAVDKVDAEEFDLVLMDIQMPGMDGYETTRRIRNDKRFSSLPILAITAHAMAGDKERCLGAGMNDYISKPVEPERFLEILRPWLSGVETSQRITHTQGDAEFEILDKVSGMDLGQGLKRIGGNRTLFYKLLRGFIQHHGKCCDQLEQLLLDGSFSDAVRLLHTLQGVSGNIGALELQKTAFALGEAMRENPLQDLDELKWGFCIAASSVFRELGIFLKQVDRADNMATRSVSTPQTDAFRVVGLELIQRINTLLREGDPDVIDLLESLSEKMDVSQTGVADQIALLQSQASDYEYDQALATLHKLTLNM